MSFPGIQDPILKSALDRYAAGVAKQVPIGRFQFVTATLVAGVEADILHTLAPTTPDDVRWIVVSSTAATPVYRNPAGTATPWTATHLWLTSASANTVRLLLFLEA